MDSFDRYTTYTLSSILTWAESKKRESNILTELARTLKDALPKEYFTKN